MSKNAIKIISLVLCVLLLCSCGQAAPAKETHTLPAAYLKNSAVSNQIHYLFRASVELYCLNNPGAYVTAGGSGFGAEGFNGSVYGPDCEDFVNSEYALDMKYDCYPGSFDPRDSHPIPWEPQSEITFDDGVTLTMERSIYPIGPEYVSLTMKCEEEVGYGDGTSLQKYVDGEWKYINNGLVVLAMLYHLYPDNPKTFYSSHDTKWLGEGLYRMSVPAEYPKEDYYVEFAVSADAEPMELPEKRYDSGYSANFFYRSPLPINCTVGMASEQKWPLEACSYTAEYEKEYDEERLAELILGEYDGGNGVYTSGDKTLTFKDGISLTNSSAEFQIVSTAFPYTSSRFTPEEFQEVGIRKELLFSGYPRKAIPEELSFLGELGGEYLVREYSLRGYELKANFDKMLKYYENILPAEEFEQKYGGLEEQTLGRWEYKFYCLSAVTEDTADTAIADGSYGDIIKGTEIYAVCADGELIAFEYHGVPTELTPKGKTKELVSPYDAADAVLPELFKYDGEIVLSDAELVYAYRNERSDTLRPVWVFTVEQKTPSPYKEKLKVSNHTYYAVDAFTGKLL